MPRSPRVTIQDVARQAGVAPITVSRVINKSGYATQDVRERVEAAVTKLGYVPNALAGSLRSRRTNTIALVLSDITNPFFTTVARGVEDAASASGFLVIVCNTDEREDKEQKYVQMLLQKCVDGVLLVPARDASESIAAVQRHQTPVVLLDRRAPVTCVDVVRCDSEGGAYQLGRLLVSLGHRDIGILTGPEGVATSDERIRGCRKALAEAGLDGRYRLYHGELTQDGGAAMARQALAAVPRPTALFASNNFITIGALKALRHEGLRVPEDIALAGFDDLPEALVTFPFLTVVAQPAYEMGRKGVEVLLARLRSGTAEPFQEVVLPTELNIRRSTGKLSPKSARRTKN